MPSCHSTNDIALEMARNTDTLEGAVVIADHQTAGKGQRGNVWHSEPGENLTCSVILKPVFVTPTRQFFLNMIVSLAVKSTIKEFVQYADCQVKWPNDVMVSGKKVAGILIENTIRKNKIESTVVGIGLNVNQTNFGNLRATSLSIERGQRFILENVFERLIHYLESYYIKLKSGSWVEIKQEYLQNLLGYNVVTRFRSEYIFEGSIVDVDDSGLLSVTVNGRVNRFDFKQIEFLL